MTHHNELCDLYLRVSLDRDGSTAIERQEADLRAYAERCGLTIREVHIDRGISGFKEGVTRKGFDAAIAALTTGTVGTLLVWKVDRLSRRGMGQIGQVLDAIEKSGGKIVFTQDGLDTSQQQARLVLALLSEVARTESANIGVRVRNRKKDDKRRGRWLGGSTPWGTRLNDDGMLEPDPDTAPLARQVAERVLAGESLRQLAIELNERGVPTQRGGEWRNSTLGALLQSPSFAGLLPESPKKADGKYSSRSQPWRHPETGETVSIGVGIVTPAERLQIMARIQSRQEITYSGPRGKRAQARHLLTGIMYCGVCGRKVAVNYDSYVCQSNRSGMPCKKPVRGWAPSVERAIMAAWVAKLAASEPGSALLDKVAERWVARYDPEVIEQRATIKAALDDDAAALADLEDARYVRKEFVGPDAVKRYERLHAQLVNRVEGLRRNLAEFPLPEADISPLLDPVQVREAWELATVPERRDLLMLAINRVTLMPYEGDRKPGPGSFKPEERLVIEWADAAEEDAEE